MAKFKYDLVCSLGANCSTCFQIRKRNLRQVALPFDWTWFNTNEAFEKLIEGFENKFCEFMKKENLRKLEKEESSSSHNDRFQYEDTYTKFLYYNHFYKTKDENKEIERVIYLFHKRCDRFIDILSKSKNVLFILSSDFEFSYDLVKKLSEVLRKQYPNCTINILYQVFNSEKDESFDEDNILVRKYQRKENMYDYRETNFEWSFLDEIKLSNSLLQLSKGKMFLLFSKIKRGFKVHILQTLKTILYMKIYLLGFRFQLIIGENKNE